MQIQYISDSVVCQIGFMKNKNTIMKKKILIIIIIITSMTAQAQYAIVENRTVLPVLTLNDTIFQNQLDSILFTQNTCRFTISEKNNDEYAYFTKIEEILPEFYEIIILYARLSAIEDDFNTGIYTLNNSSFILRESSKNPLFKFTGKKINFKYEKELIKRNNREDSYYYDEMRYPEEFCTWHLSYFKGQIKVIGLENVIPYEKPKIIDKIEPIRYH